MKWFLPFFICGPLFALSVTEELKRYCGNDEFNEQLQYLEEIAQNEDVEKTINDITEHLKSYEKCSPELFLPTSSFSNYTNSLISLGHKSEIETLVRLIKEQHKERDITVHWERLQLFAEKLGQSPYSFINENAINKYLRKGEEISAQNRTTCSTIINGAKLGKARDQDSIGWCYAHTVADLLSDHFNTLFSAVDVAHSFNSERGQSLLNESGSVNEAFYAALRKGLCLEQELPSSDYQFSQMKNYHQALRSIEILLKGAKNNSQSIENLCAECKEDILKIFPEASLNDVIAIAKNSINPLDTLFDFSCHNRFRPSIRPSITSLRKGFINLFDNRTSTGLIDEIDKQLEKNKIVGISYDSNFLYQHNYDGKSIDRADHASIITGRQYNSDTGSCDYLIRNSWGTDCDGYDWDYKCDEGYIWVPAYDLQQNLEQVHYVK